MGARKAIRTMGQFEQATHSSGRVQLPKQCGHCGKPVRETVGDSGYCKKCITLAKEDQNEG